MQQKLTRQSIQIEKKQENDLSLIERFNHFLVFVEKMIAIINVA